MTINISDSLSPLVWNSSPWSPCSKTCGGGLQYRHVQCVMRFSERNMTQDVPASFCESARVKKPAEKRKCGIEQCYSWIKSPWSQCEKSECVSKNTGNMILLGNIKIILSMEIIAGGTTLQIFYGLCLIV